MFFAVCLANKIIGYVAFNKRNDNYEIGYRFHSDYYRKGYAKESMIALLSYMKSIGITHFTAGTAINNIPSVRLLEALHFKMAGKRRPLFL